MAFQITRIQLMRYKSATLADFLEKTFQDDDEVWSGDSGDLVIGDAADFDEDDAEQYKLEGTVGEYVQSLHALVEAQNG